MSSLHQFLGRKASESSRSSSKYLGSDVIDDVEELQEMIKSQIREVEVRTGYHIWSSRRERAALGDPNSLSAKMSGCEGKIAQVLRKIEVTSELTTVIYQQLEGSCSRLGSDDAGHSELRACLDVIMQRAKMQRIDADFYAQRAKCQLTALFHLIAQNDNVVGHEIASDSRLLALAAQRDSLSVKSLAVVTMVFLPGTFVSSLFSIPLFDFDATSPGNIYRQSFWGPRLLVYAIVTVPLMMLTFAVCGLWLYYQSFQRRKQRYGAQTQLSRGLKVTELDALAKRRMSTQTTAPNLWHEALKTLNYDEQRELEFARDTTPPTPASVLATITDKKNECVKKQWVLPILRIEKDEDEVYRLVCLVQNERTNESFADIIASMEQNQMSPERLAEEQRRRLLKWLKAPDDQNRYETILQYHHPGTCDWAIGLEGVQAWLSPQRDAARCLWIHGPAGFGKTFISAWIVQHLIKEHQGSVVHFFCSADEEILRSPYSILRSWLAQMLVQDYRASDLIEAYSKARMSKGQPPTHLDLWQLFSEIARILPECVFVLDGFDECDHIDAGIHYHTRDPRSKFLQDLITYLSKTKCRLLAISRDVPDIRLQIGKSSAASNTMLMSEYAITARDTSSDVKLFSESMINHKLPKKPETLRTEIVERAAEKCEGMFLWIKLLEHEISPGQSSKEILEAVSEMPTRISEAYAREVERMILQPRRHKNKALAILRWVLFAIRPLKVKELAEALTVSGNDDLTEYPHDDLPDMWADSFVDEDYVNEVILGRCGSLIELRSKTTNDPLADRTVHFVHFSMIEYFNSLTPADPLAQKLGLRERNTEELYLSEICLHYLTLDVFRNVSPDARVVPPGLDRSKSITSRFPPNDKDFPFLTYAAWAWYIHAYHRKLMPPDDVKNWTRTAFDPSTSCSRVWGPFLELRLLDMEDANRASKHYKGKSLKAMFEERHYLQQFLRSVDSSITQTNSISERDSVARDVGNPMYYASLLGLQDVVKWLEAQGQSFSVRGGRFGFPLQAAIAGDHGDIAALIIGRCDVGQKGGVFGTALNAAAAISTPEIVELLLDEGADVTATNQAGLTALHQASKRNDSKVIEQLLNNGADINAVNDWGSTAISVSCEHGQSDALLALLGKGADLTIANWAGDLPIHIATMNGRGDLACQLLEAGSPVNVERQDGSTLLLVAVARKCLPMVKRLLEMGVAVDRSFQKGQTALHHAAANEDPTFAQLLLAAHADVACSDDNGVTPLHVAVMNGHEGVARILISHGARVAQTSQISITTAVDTGNLAVIKLLLDNGAPVHVKSNTAETLFDQALRLGRLDITEFLVRQGCFRMPGLMNAGPTARQRIENSNQLEDEFILRVFSGDTSGIKSLLQERPTTVDQEDLDEALCIAAARGYTDLVILLLINEANGNRKDSSGRTALHHAMQHWHPEVAFLLIKRGADPCLEDDNGSTPVDIAIHRGLMGLPFIQRHLMKFVDVIRSRASQLKRLQLQDKTLDQTHIRKAISGQWEGYYRTLGSRVNNPFAILIPDDARNRYSDPDLFFNADNEDQGGKFQYYGFVDIAGAIWLIKLYPDHGWLYHGQFHEPSETVFGTWGINRKHCAGTFELRRPQQHGSVVRSKRFHDRHGNSISVTDDGHVIVKRDGVTHVMAPLGPLPQMALRFNERDQPANDG
ncbi:MAG: hypothetical protein Q9160_003464 [Pyrenula sp. 1 TL-2023]